MKYQAVFDGITIHRNSDHIYTHAWRVTCGSRERTGFAKSIDAAVRAVKSAQNGITGRSNLNSRNPWCQANYQNQEYRTSVQLLEAQTTVEVVTVEQQIK